MTNRLIDSTSPYLLQHAENPVDWYPWGPEALGRATSQDVPIFLSIGYAACHWCHVMAHESFEDPETAEIMNRHFVCIKVDREERPDLDAIYMDAVVSMTGQGGWPMSVFLTPQGEPFFGGTYFPAEPMHGLPGFKQVLSSIAEAWEEKREQLMAAGADISSRISQRITLTGGRDDVDADILQTAADSLFRTYDWAQGGWGGAPKFPQPLAIEFLLQRAALTGDKLARDMAKHALSSMANGGIFDHLGGGFSRYSVDNHWAIPHFEKMLYDNAQLIRAYLHGWQVTGDETLLTVAQQTVDFCLRDLRLPDGGFASSLDADSEGEEGKFYIWSQAQLKQAIPDRDLRELFAQAYGLTNAPNFEGGYVLRRSASDEDLARWSSQSVDSVRDRLGQAEAQALQARNGRVPPPLDDKVLASWNGLMLCGLAQFARATGNARAAEASRQLAEFLKENLLNGVKPYRAWRNGRTSSAGFLEDSAALGLGWLEQYAVAFENQWFELAQAQADHILDNFADPDGGFFDTAPDSTEQLVVRPKSFQDSPAPSGNTMAVQLLLQLAALTGKSERYGTPALSALRAMQDRAAQHPTAFAGWLSALSFAVGPQIQLAFVGFRPETDYQRLRTVADRRYLPQTVIAGCQQTSDDGPALLEGREPVEGRPTAFLCQDFVCRLPTTDPERLDAQLNESTRQ
jgi:uncharacterized protein YyaL (SSP411 family)